MASSENKNKRKCLSLETKIMLIEEVDKKRKSKAQICRGHDIASSTLDTILKERDNIMAANASGLFQQGRKKIRKPDFEDVDRGLLGWFKQAWNNNIPISGPILMEKGKKLAESLGYAKFEMSIGWLNRFKARHGIAMKVICGESASVSTEVTEAWRENQLQTILQDYEPADIFNADETGLFYKCLPNRTLAEKGESCSGSRAPKDRLSLRVAANMDGSEKLPLLFIGKFAKPRCLSNIRTLPRGAEYRFNKKAWMTSALFEEWVRRLDSRFLLQGRSVALIVDNCSAHPSFLPSNTISVLQPCDQGIIRKNTKQCLFLSCF